MAAVLPAWFATLEHRLQEFYEMPPKGPGDLLLRIQSPDRLWEFFVSMRPENMVIELLHPDIEDVEVQATLAFKEEVVHHVLEKPGDLDPRMQYFERNTVVAGDMSLVQFFAQLLKRPTSYDLEILEHVRSHPNQPEAVYETDVMDAELIVQLIAANQPICVRGAFDWPAIDWSVDEFRKVLGDVALRFNAKTQQEETLGDLLDQMHVMDGQRVYSAGRGLPDSAAHLFPLPQVLTEVAGRPHIWMGKSEAGRLISKLHLDVYTSLLAQVWGKKTVYLYPPNDWDRLEPLMAYCGYQPYYFNPLEPDYERYPKAQGVDYLKVDIMPGDLLVIPSAWIHAVEVDGWTLSITRAVLLQDAIRWVSENVATA